MRGHVGKNNGDNVSLIKQNMIIYDSWFDSVFPAN